MSYGLYLYSHEISHWRGCHRGVTFLAEQADPKYGGILAAAPITTSLAILFTWSEAGQVTSRDW